VSLVPGSQLLAEANASGHAVGAFNFSNLESLQAMVAAADDTQTPVFLAVSEGAIEYAGLDNIVALARAAAARTNVPLALHLDHGHDLSLVRCCVQAGFTSVMLDASHLPLEQNIALTRQAVEFASPAGVSVEAELGRLVGVEDNVAVADRDAVLVNPDEAGRFVAATGIGSLAPAIGTGHGAFKFRGEPRLDFDRLARVRQATQGLPLVLHGASSVPESVLEQCRSAGMQLPGAKGVPEDQLRQAITLGINKVNVDTDLRLLFTAWVRQYLSLHPAEFDPRKYLGPARQAVQLLVRDRILFFRTPRVH
jgi:fructose-bisphosphate aldolase class II